MTLLYLYTLCLYMAGIHLDVVGSDMCDDGWVYYSNSATCLQTISGVYYYGDFLKRVYDPCLNKTGGEYRNISGQVVEFTEDIEPFLRNYLQFMKVTAAGVELSYSWLRSPLYTHNTHPLCRLHEGQRTYFVHGRPVPFQGYVPGNTPIICQVKARPLEPPVCPRDVKLVSVSDRNATLSWRPGQLGRKVDVYVTVQICDVPSSCRNFTHITFGDVSLFQLMNYTVAGLQPNTMYKLVLQIQNDTLGKTDCNVTLSLTTKIEPPVCPRDVTLVSVSDKNATLSWRPGQLGRKVDVYVTVQICDVPSSCRHFIRINVGDVSPFQQKNYAVSGLQPNKMYKLALQIQNEKFENTDCNVTLFLSTKKEPPICPRDVKLVSVSDTNAVLSWSPGQQGIKVIVKVEVQICLELSCEYFATRIFEEKSLFQMMNYTVSGLQPNTKYKLVIQILNEEFGTKDCNMTLALQTNKEILVCPREVTLVSMSSTNAVLSWSPGRIGIKSIVKIEVQICVAIPCEYFTARIFEEKSPFQLMNYTVSGLQPNTKYRFLLQMLDDKLETKDCNMTLALQTNEENQGQESSATVVGLAVISSISLCACSVLAILLFRYHVQAKKDKNSDIDKIVTKVMKTAKSNKEAKLQGHKNPETKRDLYVNFRVEPHAYETTIENLDDHIYET